MFLHRVFERPLHKVFHRSGEQYGGAIGDPTLLTALNSTTFFTTTRSGSQLDHPAPGPLSAGGYREIGANAPVLVPVEVAGVWFNAFLSQGAAVGLVTHSNDLTNAAWTKTGCTAELALGGLKHGPDWRGDDAIPQPVNFQASFWLATNATIDGPQQFTATSAGGAGAYVPDILVIGKAYLVEWSNIGNVPSSVEKRSAGVAD